MSTSTGPGHATLFTGAYLNIHGIVGNEWYDRSKKRVVNCVEDANTKLVETVEGPGQRQGMSPSRLLGSTLGDELRFASGFKSRVVSIALKHRSPILPAGHTANAAYWYSSRIGRFITSTYYMAPLPAWVADFNNRMSARAYCGKAWQALPETPGAEGQVFSQAPGQGSETCPDDELLSWVDDTPFMNEIELKFALEAVKHEHLGEHPATDLLVVGLSVNDQIGHAYSPYSPQVADLTLRTDRYLAGFFDALDRTISLEHVWIVLSGNHGIAPTPGFIRAHSMGSGNSHVESAKEKIENALSETFGQEDRVEAADSNSIYLSETALKKLGVDRSAAESVAADAALTVGGIMAAFIRTQLLSGGVGHSPLGRKTLKTFDYRRSGDLLLIREPYSLPGVPDGEASHGSPWNYDAQVALLLCGRAFRPGTYVTPCEVIDLVPTLALPLGLNLPSGAEGRPLESALREASGPRRVGQ